MDFSNDFCFLPDIFILMKQYQINYNLSGLLNMLLSKMPNKTQCPSQTS